MNSIIKDGKSLCINTREGSFEIYNNDNFKLYISPVSLNDDFTNYEYTITDENENLYMAFEKLYNKSFELNTLLTSNKMVEFHSDSDVYEESSVLVIEKKEDSYSVTFNESKKNDDHNTYEVVMDLYKSRYPFAVKYFRDMYYSLYQNAEEKEYVKVRKL